MFWKVFDTIDSCETSRQLSIAWSWGRKVLERMEIIPTLEYLKSNRYRYIPYTSSLEKVFHDKYNKKYNELNSNKDIFKKSGGLIIKGGM